jgi:hypothetical protein
MEGSESIVVFDVDICASLYEEAHHLLLSCLNSYMEGTASFCIYSVDIISVFDERESKVRIAELGCVVESSSLSANLLLRVLGLWGLLSAGFRAEAVLLHELLKLLWVGLVGEFLLESGLHGDCLKRSLRWVLRWVHLVDEAYDGERAVENIEQREERRERRGTFSVLSSWGCATHGDVYW